MKAVAILAVAVAVAPPSPSRLLYVSESSPNPRRRPMLRTIPVSCSPLQSEPLESCAVSTRKIEYKPGVFDDLLLDLFRNKLVKEVGWDSSKAGYEGMIEVANRLMKKGATNSDTKDAVIRIMRSLLPPFVSEMYKQFIAPIGEGKIAPMMVARWIALTCQWLIGPCTVNSIDLADGTSCESEVFVQRCKYLEESKCVGICINTCKLPSQEFFKDDWGIPLLMEPNFTDYSCKLKFGVLPPLPQHDNALKEPCLQICPNATRRREAATSIDIVQCPQAN